MKIQRITFISFILLLCSINILLAQSRVLQKGTLNANGVTYDIHISDDYDFISIYDNSIFSKEEKLISSNKDAMPFPETNIKINKEKLLTIKRKFFPKTQNQVNVQLSINVKEGKLLGLNYILPKSPLLTKDQFKSFDAQIKELLTFELIYNNYLRKQKLEGWVMTSVILR
ncbi:hypothetical protein ACP6L2_14025 [Sphingobacterium lactis]|uniref:hypothetical protein n=1 Tax=Sphingobacterium lactis TaxID=797291 RepID=UPI003F7DAEAF